MNLMNFCWGGHRRGDKRLRGRAVLCGESQPRKLLPAIVWGGSECWETAEFLERTDAVRGKTGKALARACNRRVVNVKNQTQPSTGG